MENQDKHIEVKDAGIVADSPDASPNVEVAFCVDKGTVRENNEDSLGAITLGTDSSKASAEAPIGLYAVADGLGGHAGGEIASELAIQTAIVELQENLSDTDTLMPGYYRRWLKTAVNMANKMVRQKGQTEAKNMGTTLVLAMLIDKDVYIANVGDSRAYLISPDEIHQITHDQTMVQMLVDSGTISPDEALEHPYRNMLTQAIGTAEKVQTDVFHETLNEDESLLLCSDGLWGTLSDTEILEIVRRADTLNEACKTLVETCKAKVAKDNIAVVLVRLKKPDPDVTLRSKRTL
jgi:protein phosphatase